MTDYEDFVINESYPKTVEDNALILQASPNEKHSNDWEKDCLHDFKARVRAHYLREQKRRCAYCRTEIRTSQVSAEIEHIIHKASKPDWMYEPFNLCVSCKMCNTKKSIKRVLKNGTFNSLPRNSTDYVIVHPHIDQYSQHINIIDGILYEGISPKGRKTIEICKLDRFELAAERAADKIKEEKTLDERTLLSFVAHHGTPLVNVYEKFEERIHQIFEEYKNG